MQAHAQVSPETIARSAVTSYINDAVKQKSLEPLRALMNLTKGISMYAATPFPLSDVEKHTFMELQNSMAHLTSPDNLRLAPEEFYNELDKLIRKIPLKEIDDQHKSLLKNLNYHLLQEIIAIWNVTGEVLAGRGDYEKALIYFQFSHLILKELTDKDDPHLTQLTRHYARTVYRSAINHPAKLDKYSLASHLYRLIPKQFLSVEDGATYATINIFLEEQSLKEARHILVTDREKSHKLWANAVYYLNEPVERTDKHRIRICKLMNEYLDVQESFLDISAKAAMYNQLLNEYRKIPATAAKSINGDLGNVLRYLYVIFMDEGKLFLQIQTKETQQNALLAFKFARDYIDNIPYPHKTPDDNHQYFRATLFYALAIIGRIAASSVPFSEVNISDVSRAIHLSINANPSPEQKAEYHHHLRVFAKSLYNYTLRLITSNQNHPAIIPFLQASIDASGKIPRNEQSHQDVIDSKTYQIMLDRIPKPAEPLPPSSNLLTLNLFRPSSSPDSARHLNSDEKMVVDEKSPDHFTVTFEQLRISSPH